MKILYPTYKDEEDSSSLTIKQAIDAYLENSGLCLLYLNEDEAILSREKSIIKANSHYNK